MTFDFKKEYKEFCMPKDKPQIVDVPEANYLALRGLGNPIRPPFIGYQLSDSLIL